MTAEGATSDPEGETTRSEFGRVQAEIKSILGKGAAMSMEDDMRRAELEAERKRLGEEAKAAGLFTAIDRKLDQAIGFCDGQANFEHAMKQYFKGEDDPKKVEDDLTSGRLATRFDKDKFAGIIEDRVRRAMEKAIYEHEKKEDPTIATPEDDAYFEREDWEYQVDPAKFGTAGGGVGGTARRGATGKDDEEENKSKKNEKYAFETERWNTDVEFQRSWVREMVTAVRIIAETVGDSYTEQSKGPVGDKNLNAAKQLKKAVIEVGMFPEVRAEFVALTALLDFGLEVKDKNADLKSIAAKAKNIDVDALNTAGHLKAADGNFVTSLIFQELQRRGKEYAALDENGQSRMVREIAWRLSGKTPAESALFADKAPDNKNGRPNSDTTPPLLIEAQTAEDLFLFYGMATAFGSNRLSFLDKIINLRKWSVKTFLDKAAYGRTHKAPYLLSNLVLDGDKIGEVQIEGAGGGELIQPFISDFLRFTFWDDARHGFVAKRSDGGEIVYANTEDISLCEIDLFQTWRKDGKVENKFSDYWGSLQKAEKVQDLVKDLMNYPDNVTDYVKMGSELFGQFKPNDIKRDVAFGNYLAVLFELNSGGVFKKSVAEVEQPHGHHNAWSKDDCNGYIDYVIRSGLLHENSEVVNVLRRKYGRPRRLLSPQTANALNFGMEAFGRGIGRGLGIFFSSLGK